VAYFVKEPMFGGIAERKAMIDREHDLSITEQAEILNISRGTADIIAETVASLTGPRKGIRIGCVAAKRLCSASFGQSRMSGKPYETPAVLLKANTPIS
jgi:hypothetical protein